MDTRKLLYVLVICLLSHPSEGKIKSKKAKKVLFVAGRIPPGQFEYADLSGLFTPENARLTCEDDLQCAGFSFKGPFSEPQRYWVTFFHYVPPSIWSSVGSGWHHWSSYKVKRPSLVLIGEPGEDGRLMAEDVKEHLDRVLSPDWDWPWSQSVISAQVDGQQVKAWDHIDLALFRFERKTQHLTFINPKAKEAVRDSFTKVDLCCTDQQNRFPLPFGPPTTIQWDEAHGQSFETIYETARNPVLLRGCVTTCSKYNWTLADIANTFDTSSQWEALDSQGEKVVGLEQVKSFFGPKTSAKLVRGHFRGSEASKMLAFVSDGAGSQIGPKNRDLASIYPGTEAKKQIMAISGDHHLLRTPSRSMIDLKFTLITGNLTWVFLPMDKSRFQSFQCDPKCSKNRLNIRAWISSILSQLGAATFEGRHVTTIEQAPGDTVYVPSEWTYICLPNEDSIMVQEEFVSFHSLSEITNSWPEKELYHLKKSLSPRDDWAGRRDFRRLTASLEQITKGKSKAKKKKQSKESKI